MISFKISVLWYDFWIGLFVDREKRKIYFCPLPTLVISAQHMRLTRWYCTCSVERKDNVCCSWEGWLWRLRDPERLKTTTPRLLCSGCGIEMPHESHTNLRMVPYGENVLS